MAKTKQGCGKFFATEGAGLPVRLAGPLPPDRVAEFMASCHVLVLLSDYEGLPISVLEAMAAGVVPVCLATQSGVRELVDDGETGLVVHDRGRGLVAAIERLRGDPGEWRRLSSGARRRVVQSYSDDSMAAKWTDLLLDLRRQGETVRPLALPRRIRFRNVHPAVASRLGRQPHLGARARRMLGRVARHLSGRR